MISKNIDIQRVIVSLASLLISLPMFAQSVGVTIFSEEATASVSGGANTPFWLVNQKWGTISREPNTLLLRASATHYRFFSEDWKAEGGIDIAGGTKTNNSSFWLQQLFARLDWKNLLRLDIGSRQDYTSFFNAALSSGDFIESNNARPIPQIKLSVPDFIAVPLTKRHFFVKASGSIGYLLDNNWKIDRAEALQRCYATDILYHRKSLMFRIGSIKEGNPMQFVFGLDHAAFWGADLHWNHNEVNIDPIPVQKMPRGFSDFLRVLIAKEGSSTASGSDKAYVSGSQWGADVFRYDLRLRDSTIISVYANHFFDDGSGLAFLNLMDNLYGLELQTKWKYLSGLVFEFIYTKQQSGALHYYEPELGDQHRGTHNNKANGSDNYYNNVDYVEGPSHFGYSMGTPLFLSPMYNTDGTVNFKGSRISAFHLGLNGAVAKRLSYRLLFTTGSNYGTHYVPFRSIHKGFASMAELTYRLTPTRFGVSFITLSGGYDNGSFLGGKSYGIMASLKNYSIGF